MQKYEKIKETQFFGYHFPPIFGEIQSITLKPNSFPL